MNRRRLVAWALALLACTGWLGAAGRAGEGLQEARARELIARLGAEGWDEREEAEKELVLLGTAGLKALEAAAKGDDIEIRERAGRILEKVRPLAELESPDRGVRLAAASEVTGTAEDLLAKGNPAAALSFYRRALPADPGLLDSEHVRGSLALAAGKLPAAARAEFEKSDLGLYLAKKSDELRREFPKSYLAGKALYGQGAFEEYLRLFPAGFYAPPARYCLIAGHKAYFSPNSDVRPLRMTDPGKELREWPQFLKDYPDFEGADDASYRLARALEEKGRLQEACLRLRLRLPDGDMELNALERMLFIMDAKMGAKELGELRAALEKDQEAAEKLLLANSDLAALTHYLEAMKLLRDGRYKEAGLAFARVPKPAEGGDEENAEGEDKAEAEAEEDGGDAGGEEEDEGEEDDQWGVLVLAELAELVTVRAEFAAKAAELSEKPDAGKLRDLAALMCSEKSQYVFMTGMSWAGGLAVSSYDLAKGPAEFCQKRSRFWQAAQVGARLLKDYPRDPAAADAVHTLALCHCRMAETHWAEHRSAYWRDRQKENVQRSIDWYTRLAKDYPDDPRAAKARQAAETLAKNWLRKEPAKEEEP